MRPWIPLCLVLLLGSVVFAREGILFLQGKRATPPTPRPLLPPTLLSRYYASRSIPLCLIGGRCSVVFLSQTGFSRRDETPDRSSGGFQPVGREVNSSVWERREHLRDPKRMPRYICGEGHRPGVPNRTAV